LKKKICRLDIKAWKQSLPNENRVIQRYTNQKEIKRKNNKNNIKHQTYIAKSKVQRHEWPTSFLRIMAKRHTPDNKPQRKHKYPQQIKEVLIQLES
jgi:hypothetical protein